MKDLIGLQDVGVTFVAKSGHVSRKVEALVHINLSISERETVAIIGESGSGKTTMGRVIVGLQKPTSGVANFKGHNIFELKGSLYKEYRKAVQLVNQDPYAALNPTLTIERSLIPGILRWNITSKDAARERAAELLKLVGVPEEYLLKHPYNLSGGLRQRVAIARAISVEPDLVLLDEPVSMVDASLRIGILDSLLEIQKRLRTAFAFITHDLAIARYFTEKSGGGRIMVLYRGRVMELGSQSDIINRPANPYTVALTVGAAQDTKTPFDELLSKSPSVDVKSGCQFHPRCPYAQQICQLKEPELMKVTEGHYSACHFALQLEQNQLAVNQ